MGREGGWGTPPLPSSPPPNPNSSAASSIISTLEALAVLVSLKMFYREQPESGKKKVTVAPTWTDNRGNGSALNKLMTTKFPACAVLMEFSAYMRISMKVFVEFTPRAGNREADHLANEEYSRFSPQNRVHVDLAQMQWDVFARCSESRRIS